GITESIINTMSQLPRLKVMARSTVFRYKGKELDALTIGRELNVRAVLTGRIQPRGEALNILAELVNVADGAQLWGEQFNREIADIFAVQEEIAEQICERLRVKLSGEQRKRLAKRPTRNAEAYKLYLKGRFYWNKRSLEYAHKSFEFFNRTIEMDDT